MVKKKRTVKQVKHTRLIVGEGPIDRAFLKYLQWLYDRSAALKVTVIAGDGGSPHDVIKTASKRKDIAYDERWVLIDSDVPLTEKDQQTAKKDKVHILQSAPVCLEGMLLKLLGESVPNTNEACKKQLHDKLSGDATLPDSYAELLPQAVLESCNDKTLTNLIRLFRGRGL